MIQHPRILKNNIEHLSKRETPPFFHSDTSVVLWNVLVHYVEKSHFLVVTVELIWLFLLNILSLNFLQKPNKSLRLWKFRRSYVHRSVVVQTNHCQISTAFLLDGRCAKWPHSFFSFFCGCLSPTIVHLRNLFCCSNVVNSKVGKQAKRCEIVLRNSCREEFH